jgi:flagellar motor switch protein FliN/FliY
MAESNAVETGDQMPDAANQNGGSKPADAANRASAPAGASAAAMPKDASTAAQPKAAGGGAGAGAGASGGAGVVARVGANAGAGTVTDAGGSAGAGGAGSAVRPPDLDPSPGGRAPLGDTNLDMILDIPVTIAMEIGRVRVPIRNLLQLTQGSVVELERLAGEALDVTVNGTLIAHGEVVVVNERYGIRFTDVISPAERVQKLR